MRLFLLLPLVMMGMGFSYSTSAGQCEATQVPQAIAFQAISLPVTLKEGAIIMDIPYGKALARVSQASTASATGVSKDGCWWEIVLPGGSVGYVSASQVHEE
jgi:hypothetical protein